MAVEAAAQTTPRALAVVRSVPAWVWLAGLVLLSTGIRFALTRRIVAPWIMIDELIYSELAKTFAESGEFLVREHATGAYGLVYPMLISPAWAIFAAVPDAYAAAKAINALVMSLAAVPAYFLARRVLSQWTALLAAALTVAVPSMVYTGTLMTENAFYPILLATVLAMVAWLERPTPWRTVIVLGACVAAYLTRAEALAFLPALLTAPFFLAGRRALREYRMLYGIVAAGAVGVVIVQAVRGASPLGVLGAYQVAGEDDYSVGEVARWSLYHVAELDLSLGVLPFAALLLLAATARALPRCERAFVVAATTLSFWLVLEVATFASEQSFRIEERNMFYVAPLFLIALLLWIERGLPRPAPVAAAVVVVAAALPGAIPYTELINLNAVSDTIALLPLWSLADAGVGLENVALVVAGGSIAAALLFLLVPRRFALLLPALVLAYFAVSQKPIEGKFHSASVLTLFAGITNEKDWIDRTAGRDSDVAVIWSGNTDRHSIWENEFFSRSVGTVYHTDTALPGDLAERKLIVDRDTGLMRGSGGKVVRAEYVLTDGSISLDGDVVAEDERKGILLHRVDGPLRQTTRVEGLYPQDTWSGPAVTYTRSRCAGGTLAVELQSDTALVTRPQTVRAFAGSREVGRLVIPPGKVRVLRVPLEPEAGACALRFTIAPTAVPAVVTKGESTDPRDLGVHFNRFAYRR